ncbi:hypothetical protein VTN77DRAFT_752 [Rasamsonia byssochlamydoides]|uniref:uncharacterized protein n=1 Tax=Rasamsonia byssochlamydoides TaxID=89139 RepID=UPI003743D3EC
MYSSIEDDIIKKRMDEAQREMERNALGRNKEDDDKEDDDCRGPISATTPMIGGISSWGASAYPIDPERRGVRERDRDLLEGARRPILDGKQDIPHTEICL